MKKIFYIICSVLLFAGCSEDVDLISAEGASTPKGEYKISANIDTETTKVDIDGTVVKWKEGDYITIAEVGEDGTFSSSAYFYIDSESISEDGKSAEFYGNNLVAGKTYIAVNGWAYIVDDNEYYQTLGIVGSLSKYLAPNTTQTEDNNDSNVESQWHMISSPFEVESDSDISIGFENESSYMELNISMEEGAEACEVQSISLDAPAQMFNSTIFLDSDCDIILSDNSSSLSLTLDDEPTISSTTGYTAYIPFIPNDEITEVEGDFTITMYTTDQKESSVTIPAKVLSDGTLYTKDLQFSTPVGMIANDRATLVDIYNSLGGDNWNDNTNWCTDAPLNDWYGVETNYITGRVSSLVLTIYDNPVGSIPESIGNLGDLEHLYIYGDGVTGSIPESISNLKDLTTLVISCNNLTGHIPESIGTLTNLRHLNLGGENLTGSIPESIGNLGDLEYLCISGYGVTGSIPESISNLKNLTTLYISGYNLTGHIPESIGTLTNLRYLWLMGANLTGSIPESIGNLTHLENLVINGGTCSVYGDGGGLMSGKIPDIFGEMKKLTNLEITLAQFSGSLPPSIGTLTTLETLCLSGNQLEGSIEVLDNLKNLTSIGLQRNKFTGTIPSNFGNQPYWNEVVWYILNQQSGYGFTSFPDVYLEPSTVTTIEGKTINTQDFFSYNELTCVVLWRSWCGHCSLYMETIKNLYNSYANKGFGLISLNDETDLNTITSYVSSNNIPGHVCQLSGSDYSDGTNRIKYMPTSTSPTYAFVDSEGKILFCETLYAFDDPSMSREEATIAFLENYFGEPSISTGDYESTDYSKDGEVITLQSANVGDGINLVIVGDGFIDTDMEAGGEYETRMKEAMEHFFSEEPFTTYRDSFNVYTVKAVSKNDRVIGTNETVFSSVFGDGTAISGNDTKVFEYALKVPSITDTNDLTVITVLNSSTYAGTCYMYTDNSAVAYCPIVSYDDESFRQIVIHEAGGHGFAKLLDEYAYEGTIPAGDIEYFNWQQSIGWGANVDVTNDPATIQWADLLADSRYSGLVGIYEGALTYEYGAYRPTDVSIMRYNTGGYNPPSRKEIYRRIMELSGGSYNYEEFVTYDAINRSVSSQAYSASQTRAVDKSTFVPLAQPVVVNGSPKVSK